MRLKNHAVPRGPGDGMKKCPGSDCALCVASAGVLGVAVDRRDDGGRGVPETGRRRGEGLSLTLVGQHLFPIAALLVEVLLSRRRYPPVAGRVEGGAHLEDAMARRIIGGMADAQDDVPILLPPHGGT